MHTLSGEHGFDVTDLIVPTGARLYKDDFEGLNLTAEPYFIRYVRGLPAKRDSGSSISLRR